ncbi:hypothetical protein K6X13_14835 [Xanthomonas euvesicatoria pv. allii]|uniref:hypothetical protein n=1 Tax=Xanthomonas euvesicatoria TaxID=456327 RepID=UPI00240659F0|nr:hypothetical protein [Xanthomonas euvesicatoria]MCP3048356.1 hypothetical protein [Xanthomonas euvesicatoria pv. allii]
MSMPFQPLGCSLHGVQTRMPEHDEKEQRMASTRADASQRIVAALDSKGGMLTAAQLREELRDVEAGVRYTAVNHLKNTGIIESQGKASNIIYSLVRSSPVGVEQPQASEGTSSSVAESAVETQPPTAERSSIPWVGEARLLLDADHRIEGVRFEDPAPFAMTDRLDAIADDLQDALEDACRARLPHALISALVTSSGALRRALKTLTA